VAERLIDRYDTGKKRCACSSFPLFFLGMISQTWDERNYREVVGFGMAPLSSSGGRTLFVLVMFSAGRMLGLRISRCKFWFMMRRMGVICP
jgi:hypothetical protein